MSWKYLFLSFIVSYSACSMLAVFKHKDTQLILFILISLTLKEFVEFHLIN